MEKTKAGKVDCQNTLIGCFGMPMWENPTEFMMEAVFKHHGMKFRYISTEVPADKLEAAFSGVKAMGYKGFNCTTPHKQSIIPLLDELGESAAVMGAVNCVVEENGRYIGQNTDGKGYVESLSEVTQIEGKKVVILGAGGASRAIAVELALSGAAEITIVNRSAESGLELAELLSGKTPAKAQFSQLDGEYSLAEDIDIVINATTIGLYPDTTKIPIHMDSLTARMVVSDVIPNPPETAFLKDAAARGCKTIDGLGMLVNQGRINAKYWSGKDVDTAVMRKALEELFA